MELRKENKTLIIAVIIVILLVIVSFQNNGITGLLVSDGGHSQLTVSPSIVRVGELLFITVNPGSTGVNQKLSFYQLEDSLRKRSVDVCDNPLCYDDASFSFTIPTNWEHGVYRITVYDYDLHDFLSEEFTIRK